MRLPAKPRKTVRQRPPGRRRPNLYVRYANGHVALVPATADGYKEVSSFQQPDRSKNSAWAHPVVCDGKLYLRDWGVLLCYDVKGE